MRGLAMATVAVVLAGVGIGCSKARSDESIANEIKAGMFSDAQTKSASINVAVKDGSATLTGQVPDENARYEAFKIAKETAGVVNVEDQMTLPPPVVTAKARVNSSPTPKPERKQKQDGDSLPYRALADSPYESPYGTGTQIANVASETSTASQPTPAEQPAPAPAAAPAPEPAPAPAPVTPAPPAVRQVNIPGGTPVHIQMIDSVDSARNHAGDVFHASIASPIAVDGETIVPTGTDVYVKLVNASSAGHMTGRSELTLQLARLDFQGTSYTLASDDYHDVGKSRGTRTAETVGGGAAVGAIIGGIIGGGKGAAIGAGVGGGGGAAAQAATQGQQVRIAAETKLDFILQQPVTVSYSPNKNASNR